jgi:hypothetical protein
VGNIRNSIELNNICKEFKCRLRLENNTRYKNKKAYDRNAFIERYFSICGIICKKRSMAMNDDLIVMRSLLKSNMELLKELNSINEN